MSIHEVSVPCQACNKEIGFRDRQCPSCKAPVSAELRNALENRLEASDLDYKESKQTIRRASAIVLVLGALYIGWGVLLLVQENLGESLTPTHSDPVVTSSLIINMILGVIMIGCFFASKRAPVAALSAALSIYVGAQVITGLVFPITLLAGIFFKVICFFLLGAGIVSALRASSVLRRLSEGRADQQR